MCLVLGTKVMARNASVILKVYLISVFRLGFSGIWFIFATNWAFMLLAVTNILHAVIVVQHFLSESNNGKRGSFDL